MMRGYREIYHELLKSEDDRGIPTNADDILSELGIEIYGDDSMKVSLLALVVYLVERVKELEKNAGQT